MPEHTAVTLTPKGEQTRERLYQTALELFLSKGYHTTTMRDIAEAAGCSLGLTYRYFRSKEDLVLALYRRSTEETSAHVAALPHAPIAQRFTHVMRAKIAQVQPYRPLLQAIMGAAMSPDHQIGVLSPHTTDIRVQAQQAFLAAVENATDAPHGRQVRELSTVLYAAHLAILLYWLYDKTPGCRSTDEIIKFASDSLRFGRRLLRLPPFAGLLSRLVRAIDPLFGMES